ncbi:hypothetical protein VQH23_02895 [Pararoseomonas sp. SCSIO 73927]|uniref:hypothetical protein n=1 Tax=Pararoseomonas sp. SCSIO 73927 TaxID=3114537 RepID=UPI0030CB2D0B
MSDTKWRKLIRLVQDGHPDLREVVVKFIDVAEPRRLCFPFWLHPPRPYVDTYDAGPFALRAIEWMEFPLDLTDLLRMAGRFPLEVQDGRSTITAYACPVRNVR